MSFDSVAVQTSGQVAEPQETKFRPLQPLRLHAVFVHNKITTVMAPGTLQLVLTKVKRPVLAVPRTQNASRRNQLPFSSHSFVTFPRVAACPDRFWAVHSVSSTW
jgi:hypothetical protein